MSARAYASGLTSREEGQCSSSEFFGGCVCSETEVLVRFQLQFVVEIIRQFGGDGGVIASGCLHRQFQRIGDISGLHRRAKFPSNDVAALVVEDRAEIEPAPADDLEICEVGLPRFVWADGFVPELVRTTTRAGAVIKSSDLRVR